MIQVYEMNGKTWDYLMGNGFISTVRSRNDLSGLTDDRAQVDIVYECNAYGGNKLINVGVNLAWPSMFHHHPAHEQVFLMSCMDTKPLYIAFALSGLEGFMRKKGQEGIGEEDFIIVKMIYNHPEWSCFAINPGVLHGEFTCLGEQANPVLIVTEPSDMTTDMVDVSEARTLFVDAVNVRQEAI
ncbi:hypothetical protein ACG0Z4_25060 [Enterocloster aldenensis]|uniref:hypothetical protein n=1 Tax=Enterocloster aldenensis TaxID=358742 RepID=UPI000E4C3A95|nr:hypothetical protein DW886_13725 [Enterocloster aldenensis]